ncbi:hypothetical protein CDL12_22880 [Handroanthus impetiginosus]|uniref:DUF538 domain-containing protein n=1 Tax=Handroanthus impetiginosus TaxID=429701 RepID=A0A2G9GH13_9LAMI|nr:hypothetical protein CDL12_22880 [Handroanthus impetiginosus]
MASPLNLQNAIALISLFFLSSAHFSVSAPDVHDLLPLFKLPKGLLPRDIKSYSLSETDNSFTIELSSNPCYIKFNDQLVYYDKTIKGKLGYGKVNGVSGIQAKKLFIWVSVSGIDVDEKNDMIKFHVGALSEELPAKDFEEIRSCKAKELRKSFSFLEALI